MGIYLLTLNGQIEEEFGEEVVLELRSNMKLQDSFWAGAAKEFFFQASLDEPRGYRSAFAGNSLNFCTGDFALVH